MPCNDIRGDNRWIENDVLVLVFAMDTIAEVFADITIEKDCRQFRGNS
jgi:hypothetical protein